MLSLSFVIMPQHIAIIMDANRRWAGPDFSTPVLDEALQWFNARDHRFGASRSLLAGQFLNG